MKINLCLGWTGLVLAVLGTILTCTWDRLFTYIMHKQMSLSQGSKVHDVWSAPVPVVMNIYLFNWTNSHQLLEENYKPIFDQLGPYRFNEIHEKADIVFNNNNTVTYRKIRRWYFDAENSNGSLTDNVTMLNVLPVTASHISRKWSNLLVIPMSTTMRLVEKKIWVSKTASELLFDGYDDPLLALANNLPGIQSFKLPADKLGFFYGRNGSKMFDGVFNMETGVDDIAKVGLLRQWNYNNVTDYYEGHCGEVRGSAGQLFHPDRIRGESLEMFAPDICRYVVFDFLEETEVHGIKGYKYVLGNRLLDNGTKDPDTWCNCGGECYPSGILNVSTCRSGAPAYVSFPHFLDADPFYSNQVVGMNPDSDKHRFHITLEPKTGFPLRVAARLQVNLMLQPNPRISLFEKVPRILFPMIWFEERLSITPEIASNIRVLLQVPDIGMYCCIGVLILGLILLGLAILVKIITFVMRFMQKDGGKSAPTQKVIYAVLPQNLDISRKGDEKESMISEETIKFT